MIIHRHIFPKLTRDSGRDLHFLWLNFSDSSHVRWAPPPSTNLITQSYTNDWIHIIRLVSWALTGVYDMRTLNHIYCLLYKPCIMIIITHTPPGKQKANVCVACCVFVSWTDDLCSKHSFSKGKCSCRVFKPLVHQPFHSISTISGREWNG